MFKPGQRVVLIAEDKGLRTLDAFNIPVGAHGTVIHDGVGMFPEVEFDGYKGYRGGRSWPMLAANLRLVADGEEK
jgi:hypothetical protein